jgi:AcrR family transcriptional regulator
MPKLSYKERARQRREQEILKTAARMIRDNGYVNLNMDELAEAVGISKPTLYQHFRGKDDMVAKAMLHSMQQIESFLDDMTDDNALDRLEKLMRYMLWQHTDPNGFSAAIMRDGINGLKHLTDTPDIMQATQMRVSQQIMHLVQQAKTDGAILPDIPNVVVIGMMFSSLSILQGPAIMRDHSDDVEDLINHTVAMFRRGVACVPS